MFAAKDGKAVRLVLRLGDAVGDRFEVLDGLSKGDLVVVRGNERLRPGQSIAYKGMTSAKKSVTEKPKDNGGS
ncbi:MAG: hypothetical protein JKY20_10685 [Alphaproteobacteria bacterium]|nr:hypothetical protein [Alphaproteobacteria bacterium]